MGGRRAAQRQRSDRIRATPSRRAAEIRSCQGRVRGIGFMSAMFWKAVFAFVALPGTVAFVVPLTVFLPRSSIVLDRFGLVLVLLGVTLLLSTVREFYVA